MSEEKIYCTLCGGDITKPILANFTPKSDYASLTPEKMKEKLVRYIPPPCDTISCEYRGWQCSKPCREQEKIAVQILSLLDGWMEELPVSAVRKVFEEIVCPMCYRLNPQHADMDYGKGCHWCQEKEDWCGGKSEQEVVGKYNKDCGKKRDSHGRFDKKDS